MSNSEEMKLIPSRILYYILYEPMDKRRKPHWVTRPFFCENEYKRYIESLETTNANFKNHSMRKKICDVEKFDNYYIVKELRYVDGKYIAIKSDFVYIAKVDVVPHLCIEYDGFYY